MESLQAAVDASGGLAPLLEATKDKLRASTVHGKELSKEVAGLRAKGEALAVELASARSALDEARARFADLKAELGFARDELKRCEAELGEAKDRETGAKLTLSTTSGTLKLEAERAKADLAASQRASEAASAAASAEARAELGALRQARRSRGTGAGVGGCGVGCAGHVAGARVNQVWCARRSIFISRPPFVACCRCFVCFCV